MFIKLCRLDVGMYYFLIKNACIMPTMRFNTVLATTVLIQLFNQGHC